MGSSKKTCWLCEQTLRRQADFSSRGSHGEISAHWTVQGDGPLGIGFQSALIEGLSAIQALLIDRITQFPGPRRHPVPQSTPAVTSTESAATIAKLGHRREAAAKEVFTKGVSSVRRDETLQVFGPRVKQISAICLPADDETPRIVDLDVREKLAGLAILGTTSTVPDFRPFWGDILHLEQDQKLYTVKEQENKANEGTYMVFFNASEDLPPNRCIATMLQVPPLTTAGLSDDRLFWRGDVFFVRFEEEAPGGGLFLSLCPGADLEKLMVIYLQHSWDHQELEKLHQSRQQMHELSERHDRNRELIRARLTPLQIEILSHLPLGLEANLEYLAIQEGDYGAISNPLIVPCDDDPSMVRVTCMRRVEKLEKMGWAGISAEQL